MADDLPPRVTCEQPIAVDWSFTPKSSVATADAGADQVPRGLAPAPFQESPNQASPASPFSPVSDRPAASDRPGDDPFQQPERPAFVLTAADGGAPAEDPPEDAPRAGFGNWSGLWSGVWSSEQCTDWTSISFMDDARGFLPRLGSDALGLVNWNNAIILGVALGGSLAIRSDLDGSVRDWTAEHPDRWGIGTRIIGQFGVAQYQVPVILGAYAYTVYAQDAEQHEMMYSLISAFTLTGLSTVVIKGIADTDRPSDTWNGGKYGFPSYHTASMFAMSAVLDEYEGHWIGVPAYMLSGLVGWSRIDTRDHDLSDVVFGSVMGYVIGKSVAGKALYGDSRVHILPTIDPVDGTAGLVLDASF